MENKDGASLIVRYLLKQGNTDKRRKLEARLEHANERMRQTLEIQQVLGITNTSVLKRYLELNQRIEDTQVCSVEDLDWLEQEVINSSQNLIDYLKRRNIEQVNQLQEVGTLQAYAMAEETLGKAEGGFLKDAVETIMQNDVWLQTYALLNTRIETMLTFLEANTILDEELQAMSGRWKELRTMLHTRVLSDCESLFQVLIEEVNQIYRPGENLLALLDRKEL